MSNTFPIGYISCMKCNKPALWLVEKSSCSQVIITGSIQLKYELISYKHPIIDDYTAYICDSCGEEVLDDNFTADYIVFLNTTTNVH